MKFTLFIIILFCLISYSSFSQQWTGSSSTDNNITRNGNVGIGVSTPTFQLDVNSKIGINSSQVIFLPDQTSLENSLIIGNGGTLLSNANGGASGQHNVFFGMEVGKLAENAWGNVFIGALAGESIVSGSNNLGIGFKSGNSITSGIRNMFLGASSGRSNTSGSNNIAIGMFAGRFNETGSENVFIGYQAGYGADGISQSGNVFIGYRAGYVENSSNKLYIENSSSSSPLIYGEFDNDLVAINGDFYVNGKTWAEEVEVVSSVTWPDYVFENDYSLMSISELEKYINDNGHLPEIPKAEEAEQGIKLGEMNAKLLKKIEELTLYIIQQEKRIKELEKRIKE